MEQLRKQANDEVEDLWQKHEVQVRLDAINNDEDQQKMRHGLLQLKEYMVLQRVIDGISGKDDFATRNKRLQLRKDAHNKKTKMFTQHLSFGNDAARLSFQETVNELQPEFRI